MSRRTSHLEEADKEYGAALHLRAKRSQHPADIHELERWIDDDEDRVHLVEGLNRVWDGIGAIGDMPEVRRWRVEASRSGARTAWTVSHGHLALAASFLLTIALGAMLLVYLSQRRVTGREFASAIGQRRELALSDGSHIMLDAASRVVISYRSDERVVRLVTGQARFRVAHDPDRPFRVGVADEEVRALGTDFNIANVESQLSISLMTGSVLISRIEEHPILFGLRRITTKRPIVTLKPGEQLERNGNNRPRVSPFNPQIVNAWQSGQIVFEDLPLHQAVALANRYSPRQIELDPHLPVIRLSGVFKAGDGAPFAEVATTYIPGAYLQVSPTRIVIRKAALHSSARQ